jgi:hypothetical protein
MTRQQVLDLYFMDARCKLIELAAYLDRVERASGEADFRHEALLTALQHLNSTPNPASGAETRPSRAKQVLLSLSDPTLEPIAAAPGKGACGAWPGASKES